MPLVYLPDRRCLLLWGDEPSTGWLDGLVSRGAQADAELVVPAGRRAASGLAFPLRDAVAHLAALPAAELARMSPAAAVWTTACKMAISLLSRERVVPVLAREGGELRARWAAALSAEEDRAYLRDLACSMPPAAHAVPSPGGRVRDVWAPEPLLRAFLDAAVDAFVRKSRGAPEPSRVRGPRSARLPRFAGPDGYDDWERRFEEALMHPDAAFEEGDFTERNLAREIQSWSAPALGGSDRLRACFRLEIPEDEGSGFYLRFLLQSPDDPSLILEAKEAWNARGSKLAALGKAFRNADATLLEALGRAARLFPPVARSLSEALPVGISLDPAEAWEFLSAGAAALSESGFGVILPAELTATGKRRLRMKMRIGKTKGRTAAGGGESGVGFDFDNLVEFDWQVALGDETLSKRDLMMLARLKSPLVRFRGQWVAVDPAELAEATRCMEEGGGRIGMREAVAGALAGEARVGSMRVVCEAAGSFGRLLERLRNGAGDAASGTPVGFRGTLRPYQGRGLSWLSMMSSLGLGSCLADDMGLGKTVQVLAFLEGLREQARGERRPALLVAPTSVLGNWEREAARFVPGLPLVRHYGLDRAKEPTAIEAAGAALVVTSYGLMRRDSEMLSKVAWSSVILDEAQNIKNASSATARAAREMKSPRRIALTGTPVENRLAELWSIFEFCNPGFLGPANAFRNAYAVPIERFGDREAAQRLRRIAAPFLLRRLKSDPAVISDLPAKNEMKVVCTLTREQATLYQAVVTEALEEIERSEGIGRRGLILKLLMALKQICNHPAQYLAEAGPLPSRSGKLDRVTEMLEEVAASGDKALVFTQFTEMGDRLLAYLQDRLRLEVAFLHGGTPRAARDRMVRSFQEDSRGPQVFILSVKAGGTGLNLTAASHVFHFDRWWNPAVEDQATDRAYRIGQKQAVQVHKLVTAGTVEEKIDAMLERKRDLARQVVGTGEQWITEMGDGELRALFSLSADAAVAGDEEADASNGAPARRPRRSRGAALAMEESS